MQTEQLHPEQLKAALLDPDFYPHPVHNVRYIETQCPSGNCV